MKVSAYGRRTTWREFFFCCRQNWRTEEMIRFTQSPGSTLKRWRSETNSAPLRNQSSFLPSFHPNSSPQNWVAAPINQVTVCFRSCSKCVILDLWSYRRHELKLSSGTWALSVPNQSSFMPELETTSYFFIISAVTCKVVLFIQMDLVR